MRRGLLLVLTTGLLSSGALSGGSAVAAERCVGNQAGCFPTVQAALDAAMDGDTIRLPAGTFAGGATVTKSVDLVGAGQFKTFLKGGGPVLTIGEFGAEVEPTVSIRELTITGGRTTSSPQSVPFVGVEGVLASGGGIEIPPGAGATPDDIGVGATVSLTRTRVVGNRVAPVATVPSGLDCPGGEICPFAAASGGGIDSWGTLTVTDSTISGNRVGSESGISPLASDAEGGGIHSLFGPLTIIRSRITDNTATATAPNGRFADAGGIFDVFGESVTVRDSEVSGNRAALSAGLPNSVDLLAVAGGIHLGDGVSAAEVSNSVISRNTVRMTNSVGDVVTFSGGLHVDGFVDFRIADSLIAGNRVSGATTGASAGFVHGDGGAGQLFGEMVRTRVRGNSVTATSAGDAEAMAGGLWVLAGSVSDSELFGNELRAAAANGSATVRGGAAVVDAFTETGESGLTLTGTSVRGNAGTASGRSSLGQGGGLFDAVFPDGPFGGPLTLVDSTVTRNVLSGRPGATLQGGGVFIAGQTATLTSSAISGNVPDQCFGCGAGALRRTAAPAVAGARRAALSAFARGLTRWTR